MNRKLIRFAAVAASAAVLALNTVPAAAEGLGPYGDITGPYTWEINGKGWTVYTQNGLSWVYDDYGNRTYLDSYGNRLDGVSQAAAMSIAQYKLTYNSTYNGVVIYSNPDGKLYSVSQDGVLTAIGQSVTPTPTPAPAPSVSNYVFTYSYSTANGLNIYTDNAGRNWYFDQSGIPHILTWGYQNGSYWRSDVSNYNFYYSYRSNDGYYIYRDDYGNSWWFGNDGQAHLVSRGSGGGTGGDRQPSAPYVDYSRSNTMDAGGIRETVYVGQSWTAPTTVSWAPEGMRLIGWDYTEGSGYVRWKPGAKIQNTGSDLYLYAVYGR